MDWFLLGVPAPLPDTARKGLRTLPYKVLGFGPRHDGGAPSLRKLQPGSRFGVQPAKSKNITFRRKNTPSPAERLNYTTLSRPTSIDRFERGRELECEAPQFRLLILAAEFGETYAATMLSPLHFN